VIAFFDDGNDIQVPEDLYLNMEAGTAEKPISLLPFDHKELAKRIGYWLILTRHQQWREMDKDVGLKELISTSENEEETLSSANQSRLSAEDGELKAVLPTEVELALDLHAHDVIDFSVGDAIMTIDRHQEYPLPPLPACILDTKELDDLKEVIDGRWLDEDNERSRQAKHALLIDPQSKDGLRATIQQYFCGFSEPEVQSLVYGVDEVLNRINAYSQYFAGMGNSRFSLNECLGKEESEISFQTLSHYCIDDHEFQESAMGREMDDYHSKPYSFCCQLWARCIDDNQFFLLGYFLIAILFVDGVG